MPDSQPLRVVAIFPSDVIEERKELADAIHDLNHGLASDLGLRLDWWSWDSDTRPGFHRDGPQGIIDKTLRIDDSDLVIGIFWQRFGTLTKDGKTGTEHEFHTAYESWKISGRPDIFVYFNQLQQPIVTSSGAEQYTLVLRFKENFPKEGMKWEYTGAKDFYKNVHQHLGRWLRDKVGERPRSVAPATRLAGELETAYREGVRRKVSTVGLLGTNERRELKKVFVDLTVMTHERRGGASTRSFSAWWISNSGAGGTRSTFPSPRALAEKKNATSGRTNY